MGSDGEAPTPNGPVRRLLARTRAVVGITGAQLRHDTSRTAIAVVGIALAVLAATLLAGVGYGVVQTGEEKFDTSGRDLWVTGGPVQLTPGAVGGFQNSLLDSHATANDIARRDSVATAVPLSFQTVYVSDTPSDFETLIGTGATGGGKQVQIAEGERLPSTETHYANGTYEGPMTREVVIDPQTAELLDVGVGDTIYVGGTISDARQNEFTVVGISPTFSNLLGAPTVVMPLSELQTVTGAAGADRATMITVRLQDGANVQTVEQELQAEYPEYDVRTNREQLQATLQRQATVIAGGSALVVLAIVAGFALTVNLLLSLVYQERETFAALKAVGCSTATLSGVIGLQALVLGILGGLVGIGVAVPAAAGLDAVAAWVTGFENVVRLTRELLVAGFLLAVVVSTLGGLVAGWQLGQLSPTEQLQ
jgi:putative ABC transport system permease protein